MLILPTIIKNHLKAQTCIYNCISPLFLLAIFRMPETSAIMAKARYKVTETRQFSF